MYRNYTLLTIYITYMKQNEKYNNSYSKVNAIIENKNLPL